uniref:Uncharacterized protein n=1 Tax=uncultured Desulfobacterium sp. TaxID=201089 RepID=E1YMW3_9BACT|nr:unknown protein [uncultured Desulfobacterium sp.]
MFVRFPRTRERSKDHEDKKRDIPGSINIGPGFFLPGPMQKYII